MCRVCIECGDSVESAGRMCVYCGEGEGIVWIECGESFNRRWKKCGTVWVNFGESADRV